jgi:hypothetical protein
VDRFGAFTLPAPPDGEYHAIAIPEEHSDDWRNPAVLKRLTALAQRIRVSDGSLSSGAQALALPLRRLR